MVRDRRLKYNRDGLPWTPIVQAKDDCETFLQALVSHRWTGLIRE